ncbi:MAG: SpoIIE family protein phosphatase [Bacteroidales bacterium]|nr:SpoIIE family protein phosphatase [Bacteroidales bacterium]
MKLVKLILVIILSASTVVSPGNDEQQVDSLSEILATQTDSSRTSTLLALSWELRNSNPELAISYGQEAIDLSLKFNDFENLAKAYSFVGVAYRVMGKYSQSIDYYFLGLDIATEHGITEQEGYAYLNLANLYIYQEYCNNALDNLKKAEEIALKIDSKSMLSYVYLYVGRTLVLKNEPSRALEFFQKALNIRIETNSIPEQAVCYKYIGDVYLSMNDQQAALMSYDKSLSVIDRDADRSLYADLLEKKSTISFQQKDLNRAKALAKQSLNIAHEIGASFTARNATQTLANIALSRGEYQMASEYLNRIIDFNSHLFSQQLSEKIFLLEYQLEKQQKEAKIEMLNKDNIIKELKLEKAKSYNFTYLFIIILLLALFITSLFLLKVRRKRNDLLEAQNQEIASQRQKIEQKNNHLQNAYTVIEGYISKITDSIQYAKKIQEAVLPNFDSLKSYFTDCYCYYLPKDFVSGDFYWITTKGDTLYVAVADCTGHGVPGAFMSIIGMDLLSQAVNQQNINEPAKILDYLNIEIRKKLRKEAQDELILKDSMDIAIISYQKSDNKIQYSGALVPLTIVRNGKLLEHKPQFTSIGVSPELFKRSFKQQTIDIQPGDWIYLYSDGYMDQFGGENKRKYMRSQFFSTLLDISQYGGERQKDELKKKFMDWKGNNEQIDDVLVLGIKV